MFFQFGHSGNSEYYMKEYGENFSFPLHLHTSFEFITLFSGEMKIIVDGTEYIIHGGESLLIFPAQPHTLISDSSRHMLCIFSSESVSAYSKLVNGSVPVSNLFHASSRIIEAIDDLSSDASTVKKKGILYSLCAEFDETAVYKKRDNTDLGLIFRIFDYVEENYRSDCSLSDLSKSLGYSYSYISRAFKSATNIPYSTFVNDYRIGKAATLLKESDKSVLDCALECGYSSLRSFNRNFKAITGMTPYEYRYSD